MTPPRYLITTQSYQHEKDSGTEVPTPFGYLLETDFVGFERKIAIPTPTDSPFGERIKPGLRGVSEWRGRIYVATWNAISVLDYTTFEILETFSHPLMADLHGIHVDDHGIVATSSLIDAVLFFDADRALERVFAFSNTRYYRKAKRKPLDTTQDYRYRGKTFAGFRDYHANHVTPCDDDGFLVTGRGKKKKTGHVVRVSRKTGRYKTWIGDLYGPHDGLYVDEGVFAVTETDQSTVALIQDRGVLGRKIVRRIQIPQEDARFWTRGLAVGPEKNLFVGQSVWSGDSGAAFVVEMTFEGEIVGRHPLNLPDYSECRIFQIIRSPGQPAGS